MKILLITLLFVGFCFGQQSTVLTFGKADDQILTWEHTTSDTLADSVSCSGSYISDFSLQINITSVVGDTGDVATARYYLMPERRLVTKTINASDKDTLFVSGLRICYTDSLIAGTGLLITYKYQKELKIDKDGGLYEAVFDSAYVDTLNYVSKNDISFVDTVVLSTNYPNGLTFYATDDSLIFSSTRMTEWFYLKENVLFDFPVRHESGDTVFIKKATTIPAISFIRYK